MRCFECGSDTVGYDPLHENWYCRGCGIVLAESEFVLS
jgi:transcription initiation factor TFIIIB Brf1 subunit/transcription initiation factor TFIIB